MYLPFVNYTTSEQKCILALNGPPASPNLPEGEDVENTLILGQRFLSKYNFYGLIDRNTHKISTGIESGDKDDLLAQFYTLAYIIFVLIVLLMILLIYLVYIRNKRIKAEEWLANH